jgi:UDP-N-acetylglucosamine diphosphorylase / glucose-1-phosphate thymidylyltransferase / UDP-N-acetylgalactosamine diphosphorylase / glucosamine-1-phosphate N-acetyltransferase / galactosamine-1-phosphate N-acetyltransferase
VKAVVLAAGRGTRMKDLSKDRPKHLIPVEGKPVLEHVILRLKEAGIDGVTLVIGHLGEMIRGHFGDGSRLGIGIEYAVQDQPTGTGSALHAARELASEGPFLMCFGDVLTSAETYARMLCEFEEAPCEALSLLNWVDDPYRGAAVYLDESGKIVRQVEKPPQGTSTTHWNQAGIFVFDPIVFEYTARLTPSARGEYELTAAVEAMVLDGRNVRGCAVTEVAWCDVGTPEDLSEAGRIAAE